MKYGAIDIGTNAARLLIGEVVKNNGRAFVKKISYTRVPLRLGFDVFSNGKISEEKVKKFVKTIKAFQLIADVYDVNAVRACATSAMREAINSKEIQKKIKTETGINIEIIDGQEEGEIILSTFFLLAMDKESPFVVIDVGGGSTEISVFENGKKITGKSFNIGTIRILKEQINKDMWEELSSWLKSHIEIETVHKVFATGGNINKLHKLMNKRFMEPISTRELKKMKEKLSNLSINERVSAFKLKPDRADVIVPATEIYDFIISQIDCKKLFVPKIGLSDGIIYSLYKKEISS